MVRPIIEGCANLRLRLGQRQCRKIHSLCCMFPISSVEWYGPIVERGMFNRVNRSEYKFQSELNQPRIVNRKEDASKGCIRKACIGRGKLRMIEEVEEFSTEFQTHPSFRPEGGSLEYGEIEIDDTLLAQAGIHARLVAKDEGGGLGEARGVEPFMYLGFSTAGGFRLAAWGAILAR